MFERVPIGLTSRDAALRWNASGCRFLTGPADGDPCDVPRSAALLADALAERIRVASRRLGNEQRIDGAAALAVRAAFTGGVRQGQVSVGGMTRLFRSADGWVSFSMSRPDDRDYASAAFEIDLDPSSAWGQLTTWFALHAAKDIATRAEPLGLSFAVLGEARVADNTYTYFSDDRPEHPTSKINVVDMSGLWAGPLAAHILHKVGARVTTVESTSRPDGARIGTPEFYEFLHHGHTHVQIDFASAEGRSSLHDLIVNADVVITACRRRALVQLGICPEIVFPQTAIRTWIEITGFGQMAPHRVAFGDDAAVAAGLVGGTASSPVFAADAIADPLTGLTAAAVALETLANHQRVHAQLSLVACAAHAHTYDAGERIDPQCAAPLPSLPETAQKRAEQAW